jgi:hypothetical protein
MKVLETLLSSTLPDAALKIVRCVSRLVSREVFMRAKPNEDDPDGRSGRAETGQELNVLERLPQRVWAAISSHGKDTEA